MVRADGLAGLSMRTLGERVGMRAQSLYSYFGSKADIYDALFRDGNEQFLEWMAPTLTGPDDAAPLEVAATAIRRYVEFCVADPVRHELLFQRTIPGFTPSPESYAVAVEALTQGAAGPDPARHHRSGGARPLDRGVDRPRQPAAGQRPRR